MKIPEKHYVQTFSSRWGISILSVQTCPACVWLLNVSYGCVLYEVWEENPRLVILSSFG